MPVVFTAIVMAATLSAFSARYGYHRDELYFRMLPAAWGYVDQPPLTPWLARTTASILDTAWTLRVPATLCAAGSVVVVAGVTRELGGDRRAQLLAAWGYAFAAAPLMLGHLLLTSTLDLLLLPAVVLAALRAARSPRWWLAVGALVGIGTWNRWLVVVLAAGIALGIVATGPRALLRSPWLWAGAVLSLVVAAPNLAYQITNDLPQLTMGQELREDNADEVRILIWPMLALLLGPPLLPVWLIGLIGLARRPEWHHARWIVVASVVMVGFTWWGGAQVHYLMAFLPVLYAAGCVVVSRWLATRRSRQAAVVGLVALNAAVSLLVALPIVPVSRLGSTPVTAMSPLVGDTVGWPAYVAQIARVRESAGGDVVPVITSNYGEAGAVARYGPSLGVDRVHSGQNALWDLGPPAGDGDRVVVVGGQLPQLRSLFASCEVRDWLDNGVGIDNEEQGQPIALCRGLVRPWPDVWPQVRHLD